MYYIRNARGEIVGNPKGYRTLKGAEIQANHRLYSELERVGKEVHDAYVLANPEYSGRSYLIYEVKKG